MSKPKFTDRERASDRIYSSNVASLLFPGDNSPPVIPYGYNGRPLAILSWRIG
ncbi:MAG: hypothetical protein ACRC62_10825 [Microcoleus sp.]